MKRICFIILTIAACFAVKAERFEYNGILYDTLSGNTCQTAGIDNFEDLEFYPQQESEWYSFYGVRNKTTGADVTYSLGAPNAYKNDNEIIIPEIVYDYNKKPYTVVKIGEFSFASQCAVKSLKLPDTVTEIGKGAFYLWQNLNAIDFGKGVETIGEGAFCLCSSLNSLTIPSNVKTIGNSAFMGCSSINELYFNEGLTTIGANAFRGCSGIKNELVLPDSLIEVGDYAFAKCESIPQIHLGANLSKVGDYAFYRFNIYTKQPDPETGIGDTMHIPPTLSWIGKEAFNFQNKNTTFTDIYYPNYNPIDIDDNAFGAIGNEGAGLNYSDDYWIYLTVCLHVPVGTRDLYKSLTGWRNFKCIIDDLVPDQSLTSDDKGSIQNIIGYVFMSIEPNVEDSGSIKLTKELFPDSSVKVDEWKIYNDKDIIKLNGDVVTPLHIGEQLVLGYNNSDNVRWNGNDWENQTSVVGAVMVFVCPTVTLVYGDNDEIAQTSPKRNLGGNEEFNYGNVISDYASYQHRAIYNSYPKFKIIAPQGIEFTLIEKGHFDESGEPSNDQTDLVEVEEDQKVGKGSETDGDYIVPKNIITDNSVIKISSILSTYSPGTTTSVSEILVNDNIKISANGRTITVYGADDNAVVKIYDTNGRLHHNTTDKTIKIQSPGIYIININDFNIKAVVR